MELSSCYICIYTYIHSQWYIESINEITKVMRTRRSRVRSRQAAIYTSELIFTTLLETQIYNPTLSFQFSFLSIITTIFFYFSYHWPFRKRWTTRVSRTRPGFFLLVNFSVNKYSKIFQHSKQKFTRVLVALKYMGSDLTTVKVSADKSVVSCR